MRIRQAMIVVALICSHGRIGSGSADGSKGTVPTQPPRGDLFSISSGPVDNPDIVSSPRIPVVGREVTLSARVRGRGKHPVEVRFLLELAGKEKVVLSGKILPAQADKTVKYADYQAKWKPTEPGIYGFTVQVDPANRLDDPFIKNNTASVTLPVTWREFHILAWGAQRQWKWITATNGSKAGEDLPREEVDYWHRRGTLMLGYMYTREEDLMKRSEADMIDSIVKRVDQYVASGCDGLLLDETGSYSTPAGLEFIRRFGAAYDKVQKQHPALRVYNWIAGSLNEQELEVARRNGHILMGETYEAIHSRNTPTFPRFVAERVARLSSVNPWEPHGPGGIIALGIGGDCGVTFRPQVENSVRLCRKLGPDLPGICYYGVEHLEVGKPYEGSLQEFLDGLTVKYFIQPVLTVNENDIWPENVAPAAGEKVMVHVRVHNIGGVPARNVVARIYARSMSTNDRVLLSKTVIPKIGNGTQLNEEQKRMANPYKVIGGTKHPAAYWDAGKQVRVFLNQALIEAVWTPKQTGHYRLEVELEPARQHTLLEGFATRLIAVSENVGAPKNDK